MWLFAMFDLPVDTREARREYTRFRKALIEEGFTMLQFSVYARYFRSEELAEPVRKRIALKLPRDGQVRLLAVTEKQFMRQQILYEKKEAEAEKANDQLLLF